MPYPPRIYLTGFMGSGKSTIGPILANVLGYHFVDLDDVIAFIAGRPIPAIFREEGEAGFRRREADALADTLERSGVVVALGGGAFAQEVNQERLLGEAAVVYLHVDPERLAERLAYSPTRRPLLCDDDGQKLAPDLLRERVLALHAARADLYAKAHLTVDITDARLGSAVDAVERALRTVC